MSYGPQVALGVRLLAVDSLAKAAYTLAGVEDNNSSTWDEATCARRTDLLPSSTDKVSEPENLKSTEILFQHDGQKFNPAMASKTRIKRPRMLQHYLSRQKAGKNGKVRKFRNAFAPVAQLVYFPILKVLIGNMPNSHAADPRCEIDELHYMLSAKSFRTIAAFTKCSVNTNSHRLVV
jgi:hypothetical protein